MVYFKTKNPTLGQFWRLENVDIVYGHWKYFMDILDICMTIWYILCWIVTFVPVLASCTKINMATLIRTQFYKFYKYL
jgi:hypothetical protein